MTRKANIDQENALWQFSLNYYSKPGVADACLFLQDNYKVDVNVLLLILWLAAADKLLSVDEIIQIDGRIKKWHASVVVPLRAVRRSIPKTVTQPSRIELRERVKMLELHAERIEQDDLFAFFKTSSPVAPNPGVARQSLDAYACYLNCSFEDNVINTLLASYEALRTV